MIVGDPFRCECTSRLVVPLCPDRLPLLGSRRIAEGDHCSMESRVEHIQREIPLRLVTFPGFYDALRPCSQPRVGEVHHLFSLMPLSTHNPLTGGTPA